MDLSQIWTEIEKKKAFRRAYGATSSLFKQHVLHKTKKSFTVFKFQVVTVGSKGLVNGQTQEQKKPPKRAKIIKKR